jgi:hypothetical protein
VGAAVVVGDDEGTGVDDAVGEDVGAGVALPYSRCSVVGVLACRGPAENDASQIGT